MTDKFTNMNREERLEAIEEAGKRYTEREGELFNERPPGWENENIKNYDQLRRDVQAVVDPYFDQTTRCAQHYKVYKFLPEKLQYSPCCDAKAIKWDAEVFEELGDNYFDHHPQLVKRKEDLFNGVRNEDCKACWIKEDRGMRSMRYDQSIESYKDIVRVFETEETFNPREVAEPARFEMWMNSTCNLGCFMCNSGNSNTLRKIWGDKWDTNGTWVHNEERYQHTLVKDGKDEYHERFLEQVKEKVKSRLSTAITGAKEYHGRMGERDQVSIAYLGGEPTLHNEMFDHADEFIEAAKPAIASGSDIKFEIVTNGTSKKKLSDRVMEIYKKYAAAGWHTRIMLSQDATHEQANVRHGADFNEIKRNFTEWLSPDSPIQEVVSFTVMSNLNLPYINNMAEYLYESCVVSNKPASKTLRIHFNSIYSPSWMMLHHLPKKYMEKPVNEALETFRKIQDAQMGVEINYSLFENLIKQSPDEVDRDELLSVFNAYKYTHETYSAMYPGWSFWETFPHTVELAKEYNIDITEKSNPKAFVRKGND